MNISDILKERDCGYFRINSCFSYGAPLEKVMESFGLAPLPECLRKIEQDEAIGVLKTILWKDLAYSSEMISEEQALERASYLYTLFYDASAKLYTNGNWENYHKGKSAGSSPLTSSTFDAGVLFFSKKFSACIWVEDED